MDPGERLKLVRAKLGITTREVALFSKLIADAEGNTEFLVSGPWLTQIENEKSALPSIYKLFTLASIYGLGYSTLLEMYGVDLNKINVFHSRMPIAKTHLAQYDRTSDSRSESRTESLDLPVRFDAALNLRQTNLLSRMIEIWGKVPLEFIQHLDLRHRLYGFVGLSDYTLYPLLRPGSFVEIDPELKNPHSRPIRSEFDRPIYFIDLRTEYACSWCEIIDDKLLLIAHSLSPIKTRSFAFPKAAEIIGQVTGVAMRVGVSLPGSSEEISKGPSQS
ncbi:MAG TPA: helix-turn-helix domain-containing protein [Candidatus Saccharimonadales bacterium]|jgi:transcriptional regulator with XRE-family HTH domain|nr:helix-turn-helix domain-containing protein [Candidatus Saccharimonadales bacterium]